MQVSVDKSIIAALQTITDTGKDGSFTHTSSRGSSVYEKGGRFTIVPSQRKHRKLIDINAGHTYTVKKVYKDTIQWRCSMRSKSTYCKATVLQTGKTFRKGRFEHIHPGRLGAAEFMQTPDRRRKRKRSPAASQLESKPEVPEINMRPDHRESEVGLTQTAAENMDDSSDLNDQNQGVDVQEDYNIAICSSQRAQSGNNVDPVPSEVEVSITEVVVENAMGSCRSNMVPDHVGSEVDITESETDDRLMEGSLENVAEFQEQRLQEPEYTVVDCSSQRLQPKLIDSAGYTYTRKHTNKYTTYWRCSIRNANTKCHASVMQRGETFRRGDLDHIHPGKPNSDVAAKIVAQVKTKALQEPIEPADKIVDEALLENVGYHRLSLNLPSHHNLARTAIRLRQNMQSHHPDCLQDGSIASIPAGFLKKIVKCGDKAHILLASPQQLQLLAQVKLWFIDLNSKVVKAPFKQLVSIHAFVAAGKETKPVPMAFALMSAKKKKDYKAVFNAVKDCLPTECPVKECILDYEADLWTVISDVFPGIQCSGSAFYWSQAIWKKIQGFGIHQSYMYGHTKAYRLLRKLLALPFLPAELIPYMVTKLQEKANTGTQHQLLNYVEATWIEGPTCLWPPSVWSVYMQPFRIKTDFEDWNRRLNRKAKRGKLPFIDLIMHLFNESKLASKTNIKEHPPTASKNNQVVKFWEEFRQGNRKLKQLLSVCATIFEPESSK